MNPTTRRHTLVSLIAMLATLALLTTSCGENAGRDSEGGEFYADGDTVEILVPFSAGGGTDTLARMVAPFLAKELGVDVQVRNQPGGGSVIGTNDFVDQLEPDGYTLLMSSSSSQVPAVVGQEGVRYSFDDFTPIVGFPLGGVIYAGAGSPFQNAASITGPRQPRQLHYSGQPAAGGELRILLMFEMYETDVQTALGFEGRGDARLAWEQGESDISYDTTPAYLANVKPLVDQGKAVPLMSFGVVKDGKIVRDPAFPDLPSPADVYTEVFGKEPSGNAFEAYKALAVATLAMNKGLHLQKDAPQQAKDELSAAWQNIAADPEFQAAAKSEVGDNGLLLGDEVNAAWAEMAKVNKDSPAVQWLLKWVNDTYDVQLDKGEGN
jgi:tripartite-type tricarboxylate transporter receptor subunit TctC